MPDLFGRERRELRRRVESLEKREQGSQATIRTLADSAEALKRDRDADRVALSRARADMAAQRGRADRAEQELAVARDSLRTRIPELQVADAEKAVRIRDLQAAIEVQARSLADKDHVIEMCEQDRQALADRLRATLADLAPPNVVYPGTLD